MALPTERTVTGTYTNPVTGNPYDGTTENHFVIFEPVPERWTDQGGNQILVGGGTVTLDANGQFSEALVTTDADDVLPEDDRLWRLREFIDGEWNTWYFALPEGDGSDIDITDILSVTNDGITFVPVPGPEGPAGPAGADGEDGLSSTDGGLTTGIALGGDIEVNDSNPLAVDISPMTAYIVDYLTDPIDTTTVETTSTITLELDNAAQNRAVTWILMDGDQNFTQQETVPTPEQRRQLIVIGVVHVESGSIISQQSIPVIVQQPINQFYDFLDAVGAFNISGNEITANANLTLAHSAGTVFSRGWNHFSGPTATNNPHYATTSGNDPAEWISATQDSSSVTGSASANIDVANYDVGGTVTAIGGGANRSTIFRLWIFPENGGPQTYVAQYGQTIYSSLENAVNSIPSESYITNPALPTNGILLGYLAVKHTATDISDTDEARFVRFEKFGGSTGTAALSQFLLKTGGTITGSLEVNGGITVDGSDVPVPVASVTDYLAQSTFTAAHRGSGGEFPEHTMESYASVVAGGAEAIEVSCTSTADGVLVCFHDTTLSRMTGFSGSTEDYSYSQLKNIIKVNAKELLGEGWPLVEIPTLREVLDRFVGKVVVFLEPKTNAASEILTGGWLVDNYPTLADHIIWKVFYTNTTKTFAQAQGMRVWGYINAGTSSAAMDAEEDEIDFWGVPHTATDSKIQEVVDRPAGKDVMVWSVHRYADIDRLTALGVKGFMESNWLYLNQELEDGSDQFHTQISTPGTIGVDPLNPNFALKYDSGGRAFIDNIPNNGVLMGRHKVPEGQDTYTISFTMTWDNVPGTNLHSGIAFAKPDDTAYIFSGLNDSGGYHVVFRNNGTLQLYRHDAQVFSGTQLVSVGTETPLDGVAMTFEVDVTASDITVRRTDVGPYEGTTNDTTYRGRYMHLSPGSVSVDADKPFWSALSLS